MSRKCEYGVLEITSDTKVSSHESKTSDLTRLLYHQIAILTFPHSQYFHILTCLVTFKGLSTTKMTWQTGSKEQSLVKRPIWKYNLPIVTTDFLGHTLSQKNLHCFTITLQPLKTLEIKTFDIGSRTRDVCS